MAKISITLVLFFLFTNGFSQVCFTKSISNSEEEIPMFCKQIGKTYYIGIRICHESMGLWNGTRILKMNEYGEIQSELLFDIVDNSRFIMQAILPINQSEFMVFGGNLNSEEENGYLNVMRIDTSLQIKWEKHFNVNKPLIWHTIPVYDKDSNIIIGASCETFMPQWQQQLLFMKINTDGDSIQASYETHGNPDFTTIQSLISINGAFKAFGYGYESYCPYSGFAQILELDTAFNLIDVNPVPYLIEPYMTAEKIDESRYFIAGNAYASSTHYDVGIAKLTVNEDSIAYNHAGKPGTAADYAIDKGAWLKCLSIANSNRIFTGGTGIDNSDFYHCVNFNKDMMLSNYDSLLNCRWTRFYGSDTACYTMSTVEATSDGGCIFTGMYVNQNRPEDMLDVVIIKVDSLGLFTGLPENTHICMQEAIVYPNPGTDYFTVQSGPQITGAKFELFNGAGNLVLQTRLESTLENMDASHLPSGTYPWHVIYNKKVVGQGNWIHQ